MNHIIFPSFAQHVLAYNELFNFLHHSTHLLAQSLSVGDRLEQISSDQMNSVVRTIATGLYGNAILSKDVDMVLKLLRELIEIQVVVSENPRRMLRSGSCSFSRLYNRLHESLFSAKLFLTAALHEPVMKVLIGDDLVLDVDVDKTAQNYPAKERQKKYGCLSKITTFSQLTHKFGPFADSERIWNCSANSIARQ